MNLDIYGSLFLSAFLAATLLPAQSEALLLYFVSSGQYSIGALVIVASVGNVLGAIVNWWLGRSIERFKDRKWFPVKEKELSRAQDFYKRYGRWSLLLSWVPFIGDPITVVAGVMREKLIIFTILVTISKTARYIVVAYMAS
jgi:membrane protein YqaA with SNARE-associated domain